MKNDLFESGSNKVEIRGMTEKAKALEGDRTHVLTAV